ncbi:YjfK family protein [Photobacterium damselae]|uniref:YjfK family protein n=1 Tax=Photobacterium damselae TaxID=38293 RepID=UPI0012AD5E20|nr:YjfK family protein [Photobacterium damselae]
MLNWIKSKLSPPEETLAKLDIPEVLGLRLGGAFEIDKLFLQLIEPNLTIEHAAVTQLIQAVGEVKLDDHTRLLRFYTDDDGFIQILQHGTTDADVSEVRMFYFYESKPIDTKRKWEHLLSHDLIQKCWELDDQSFKKAWDNDRPVAMVEHTWYKDGSKDQTDQFVMIFERKLDNGQYEGLMACAEEKIINNNIERSLITSTSFELTPTSFTVIG